MSAHSGLQFFQLVGRVVPDQLDVHALLGDGDDLHVGGRADAARHAEVVLHGQAQRVRAGERQEHRIVRRTGALGREHERIDA
jgi:hypothetical protein